MNVSIKGVALAALMTFGLAAQQPTTTPAMHAKAAGRLVITNAMVIYGNAKPPYGPVDIVVQNGLIAYEASRDLVRAQTQLTETAEHAETAKNMCSAVLSDLRG